MLIKLIVTNLIAALISVLLVWRVFEVEGSGSNENSCWLLLLLLNTHLACIFIVATIGFGTTLIANSFLLARERFVNPPSIVLMRDNDLGVRGLRLKKWFSFFVNAIGFSLILMLAVLVLRVYFQVMEICTAN